MKLKTERMPGYIVSQRFIASNVLKLHDLCVICRLEARGYDLLLRWQSSKRFLLK